MLLSSLMYITGCSFNFMKSGVYFLSFKVAFAGVLHRGTYKVKSQVCDDDGHDWLSWTWSLEIAKDWGE